MWSEYQVVVATHFNTGTYHNHFVINSVNMFNGKKFNCNKGAYYHFRELSDELCNKYGLTVIKNPKGKTQRSIFFSEKRGEPTKYNVMRQAIDEAMQMCINFGQFKKIMYKKGYIIYDDRYRKYPTIRSINDKKAVRMYHLGEKYLPINIENKIRQNPYYYQEKYLEYVHPKKKSKQNKIYKFIGDFNKIKKLNGIDILFLTLFYLMGILPKNNPRHKPLSPEMRQEVRKLERYSNEIRLIVTEKLNTTEDVKNYIKQTEKKIEDVTDIRQKYRNKLRNCTDESLIKKYKQKRDHCTTILKEYRNKLKIANYILEDTPRIKKTIKIEKQMKVLEQTDITKIKNKDKQVKV